MSIQYLKPSRKPWAFFIAWIIFLAFGVSQFFYIRSFGGIYSANILLSIYLAFLIWGCVRIVRPKDNKYLLLHSVVLFLLMPLMYGPVRRTFLEELTPPLRDAGDTFEINSPSLNKHIR